MYTEEDLNRLTLNSVLSPVHNQRNVGDFTFPEDGKQINYIVTDENLVIEDENSIAEEEDESNSIDKFEKLTSSDGGSLSNESSFGNSFQTFVSNVFNSKDPIIILSQECENPTYIQYRSRWWIVVSVLLVIVANFAQRMSFAAVR